MCWLVLRCHHKYVSCGWLIFLVAWFGRTDGGWAPRPLFVAKTTAVLESPPSVYLFCIQGVCASSGAKSLSPDRGCFVCGRSRRGVTGAVADRWIFGQVAVGTKVQLTCCSCGCAQTHEVKLEQEGPWVLPSAVLPLHREELRVSWRLRLSYCFNSTAVTLITSTFMFVLFFVPLFLSSAAKVPPTMRRVSLPHVYLKIPACILLLCHCTALKCALRRCPSLSVPAAAFPGSHLQLCAHVRLLYDVKYYKYYKLRKT